MIPCRLRIAVRTEPAGLRPTIAGDLSNWPITIRHINETSQERWNNPKQEDEVEYLLAFYGDEKALANIPPEQLAADQQAWFKFDQALRTSVKVVSNSGLQPTSSATTVRLKNGKMVTSDGPFAETKEQLFGFYLIEAKDLDEAIAWAGKMPNLSRGGSVEVRPQWVFEQ
jgi:hypothetical protein